MPTPDAVLSFWLEEATPKQWYVADPAFDALIADRFGATVEAARGGGHDAWAQTARGALALLIVLDQFPRNIYRSDAQAFASDAQAVVVAKAAVAADLDQQINGSPRQFFYMPLMHSETLADQDLCVQWFRERMGTDEGDNLRHALAHRDVIAFFGRFPYRNAALGRESTETEQTYLDLGGYRLSAALRGQLAGLAPSPASEAL